MRIGTVILRNDNGIRTLYVVQSQHGDSLQVLSIQLSPDNKPYVISTSIGLPLVWFDGAEVLGPVDMIVAPEPEPTEATAA